MTTVNEASEKTVSSTFTHNQKKKNKKNKLKPNSDVPTLTGNTQANLKEKQAVSTPIKQNVAKPTVGKTVENQSPNKKKKRNKKKNKFNNNAPKETVNKNEGKITETVELAASIKLKNKMKKKKQIGQLHSDKGKQQVNKRDVGNKIKKKSQRK